MTKAAVAALLVVTAIAGFVLFRPVVAGIGEHVRPAPVSFGAHFPPLDLGTPQPDLPCAAHFETKLGSIVPCSARPGTVLTVNANYGAMSGASPAFFESLGVSVPSELTTLSRTMYRVTVPKLLCAKPSGSIWSITMVGMAGERQMIGQFVADCRGVVLTQDAMKDFDYFIGPWTWSCEGDTGDSPHPDSVSERWVSLYDGNIVDQTTTYSYSGQSRNVLTGQDQPFIRNEQSEERGSVQPLGALVARYRRIGFSTSDLDSISRAFSGAGTLGRRTVYFFSSADGFHERLTSGWRDGTLTFIDLVPAGVAGKTIVSRVDQFNFGETGHTVTGSVTSSLQCRRETTQ